MRKQIQKVFLSIIRQNTKDFPEKELIENASKHYTFDEWLTKNYNIAKIEMNINYYIPFIYRDKLHNLIQVKGVIIDVFFVI